MIDSERGPDESPPPERSNPVLPAEGVFLETSDPVASVAATSQVVRRPPGPGFWESIAWSAGVLAVQVGASLIAAVVLLIWSIASSAATTEGGAGRSLDGTALVRQIPSLFGEKFIFVIGMIQLAVIAYALLAIQLRLRPGGFRRLGWQRPRAGHLLLIGGAMLPLSALCSQIQNEVFNLVPWSQTEMAKLTESMSSAPLLVVVAIIGVGPAVGEELLFRGLIGRGLVARYGIVLGIAITSVLFSAVHLNPAQIVGTIPLGIAMQFVYLTTRSFWAPMTLHFLNNTFSVVLVKVGDRFGVKELAADYSDSLPGSLLLASACLVATIGLLLWQTRVRYVTGDGNEWDAGYPTAEVPPAEVGARPASQPPKRTLVLATAFCALGFAAAVWQMIASG